MWNTATVGGKARKGVALGRLLAEATRVLETGDPVAANADGPAITAAQRSGGSTEDRIVKRAHGLPSATPLLREINSLRAILRGLIVLLIVVAGLAGAATARTALTTDDGTTVNFFWAIASLLGLHAASFLVWIVLLLVPSKSSGGTLGRTAIWLWRVAVERVRGNRHRLAALQAMLGRFSSGSAGRWLAGSLTHGLWAAYLFGALLMVIALLSAQSYVFIWETTILDIGTYTRLTQLLGALPSALGVSTPDAAAVAAAQWPGNLATTDQTVWSSLLVAALLLYGVLPRLAAVVVTALLARHRYGKARLDLSEPSYAEPALRVSPTVTATEVVAGDDEPPSWSTAQLEQQTVAPPEPGPVYLFGWEIDAPRSGWPPPGTAHHTQDLGRGDGHADLQRAIDVIRATKPGRLLVVTDLRQTPDRGVTAALRSLREAAHGRLVLLLTGEDAMRQRMGTDAAARTRLADWAGAGLAAEIDTNNMTVIDLDAPPEETAAAVTSLVTR